MDTIHFENIQILWLLLIIPVLFSLKLFLSLQDKKQIKKLGKNHIVKSLMLEYSAFRPWLKFSLLMFAIGLMIFAMARPQFATETKVDASETGEIIFALDISNSMLANSGKSNFSRLKMAKNAITNILDKTKNKQVGLIVFAGQAVMQIPLTHDYEAFKLILNSINPSFITAQGTAIADAINLAVDAFGDNDNYSKSIILISDGEDHEGDIDAAIEKAKQKGVKIYTLGIGSPHGSSIIINGQPLRDRNGNIVISKLNEAILLKLAKETGGEYINFTQNTRAIEKIYKDIDKNNGNGKISVAKYDEKYHYFLFPALLILIIEFFILTRSNRWLAKLNLFEKIDLYETKKNKK